MFSLYSIFDSIDGEVNAFHQGVLTTFIRFSQCNLSCKWCDTQYAAKRSDGMEISLSNLLEDLFASRGEKLKKVTITGGEPLLQEELSTLLQELVARDIKVSIETNGTLEPIQQFVGIPEVCWVYDFKLKNSGQRNRMNLNAFGFLSKNDFVKFVVGSSDDVKEAMDVGKVLRENGCEAKFAFSPVHDEFTPQQLLREIEIYGTGDEIINLQLHKYIWGITKEEH